MASGGINKVILIGNLGQEPEIRSTNNGNTTARLNLATTRRYRDRAGRQQEQTEWHRLIAFGRTAEVAGQYLRKGSRAYIEGRLQTRSYEREGQTRYVTEILVHELQLLGGGPDPSRSGPQGGGQRSTEPATADAGAAAGGDDPGDDIPF